MSVLRVIGVTGQDAYGALKWGSARVAESLARRGLSCTMVDLTRPDYADRLCRVFSEGPVAFVFSVGGAGALVETDQGLIWDLMRVPFLSLFHDNPAYHVLQHAKPSRFVANIYTARDFIDTQKKYIRSGRLLYKVPPFVFVDRDVAPMPWKERPVSFLFLKSGQDPKVFDDQEKDLAPDVRDVYRDCLAYCENRTNFLLADVVAERMGLAPEQIQADSELFWAMVRTLDGHLRCLRMNRLVAWLKLLPATIIGSGWGHIDKTSCRATFVDGMGGKRASALFSQSQFVFNVNPAVFDGAQERLVSGLFGRACVVSDDNAFTRARFSNLPSYFGFDWTEADNAARIADFIDRSRRNPPDFDPAFRVAQPLCDIDALAERLIGFAVKVRQSAL